MTVGKALLVTESSRNGRLRSPQTLHCDCSPRTPDLKSLTTNHIERAFLTVRQELKRSSAKGWATAKTSKRTSWR